MGPTGLPRYGVVSTDEPHQTVTVDGRSVEIANHMGYADSRDLAQSVAGAIGGTFVEREEPSFGQRGVVAISVPRRCRGCDEHVCTLTSHKEH